MSEWTQTLKSEIPPSLNNPKAGAGTVCEEEWQLKGGANRPKVITPALHRS